MDTRRTPHRHSTDASRMLYGRLTGYPWKPVGLSTNDPRTPDGQSPDSPRTVHGQCTGCLLGLSTDCPQAPNAVPTTTPQTIRSLDAPRTLCRHPMGTPCTPMYTPRTVQGRSTDSPCVTDRESYPGDARGHPMTTPRLPHGLPVDKPAMHNPPTA